MKNYLFWDVDTQKDFMNENGALYVPDAEIIKPNLKRLTDFALNKKNVYLVSSVDWHELNDIEFKEFPPHCIKETEGAKKIYEIPNPLIIPQIKKSCSVFENVKEKISDALRNNTMEFLIQKKQINVFENPITEYLLQELSNKEIESVFVYGVATDFCVRAAVLSIKEFFNKNKINTNIYLIEDAIKGVIPKKIEDTLYEFKKKGVKFVKTKDVLEELIK